MINSHTLYLLSYDGFMVANDGVILITIVHAVDFRSDFVNFFIEFI